MSLTLGPSAADVSWQLDAVVAHESSKRYKDMNILCYACDPGALRTELQRHSSPLQQKLAVSLLGRHCCRD